MSVLPPLEWRIEASLSYFEGDVILCLIEPLYR